MNKELVMGNEAIALGAIDAGVEYVFGYPGTPSTEIVETINQYRDSDIYVEWSVNEKVALEAAAGAAYSGARCMVTMKQVGLNVCADPAMNLSYIGVTGGLVIVVADDPGPISSQTEQDTRVFALYSKIPLLDPSTPEEAYDMVQDAFELSEKYNTPVILRPTTRICHGYADIIRKCKTVKNLGSGFIKDDKWVCFPPLSYQNHIKVETRSKELMEMFITYRYNMTIGNGKILIITSGVNYLYAREAIIQLGLREEQYTLIKISTYPLPENLLSRYLKRTKKVVVLEELEAVLEKSIYYLCAVERIETPYIYGRLSGDVKIAGENTVDEVITLIANTFDINYKVIDDIVCPPKRQISLCAGCPHRASFYAVKYALRGKKAVFCGDIGCYTLGKIEPLNMLDTCLCMGAGITIGIGMQLHNLDKIVVSFIGDSTFFHTGIQGVINAVYNNNSLTIIILDNSTTAMTGGQPTPAVGQDSGEHNTTISIEQVLLGIGVSEVATISPFKFEEAVEIVLRTIGKKGVKAIIFKAPCAKKQRSISYAKVDISKCNGCGSCITEIGCPAISMNAGRAQVNKCDCNGCGLCTNVCKRHAILMGKVVNND